LCAEADTNRRNIAGSGGNPDDEPSGSGGNVPNDGEAPPEVPNPAEKFQREFRTFRLNLQFRAVYLRSRIYIEIHDFEPWDDNHMDVGTALSHYLVGKRDVKVTV
jgi:hypothetical protein